MAPADSLSLDPTLVVQIQSLLHERFGFLVLGAFFLAIGLVAILLWLSRNVRRGDGILLLFGTMSLLWGLRFICRAPIIPTMVGGDPLTWSLFTRFLTYVSAPVAFGFVWCVFGPGWRSSLKALTWLSAAFALVASVALLIVPDPHLLLHAFNVVVLVGLGVIVASVVRPEFRRHPALRKLVGGGIASLVFIGMENLRSLGAFEFPFDVEWVGAVILYATLGYVTVGQVMYVERKWASVRQELATARQIQTSILPHESPSATGLSIATRHVPMTEVAGDFFDFAPTGNGAFGSLIADVSGHGVPAALVAAMVKVAFQAQIGHGDAPARVLAGMNEMLGHRLQGQFVTAGYAYIDPAAGTVRYAGAGHPPLYIASSRRGVEDLLPNGLMLGPFPDARYDSAERAVEPGDRILMYTDGIVEAFNENEEEFGERRLEGLLATSFDLSADEFADRLLDEVRRWARVKENQSFDDDLTLIVIDVENP